MYNLRYHIASLVSVFLALAVGLVLGTIVVERGVLDAQKKTIVQSLQVDFQRITDENQAMRADSEAARALAKLTVDYAVAGELEGRTVAVIGTTGRSDAAAGVQAAIQAAGGTAVVVTMREPSAGLGQDAADEAALAVLERIEDSQPVTASVEATRIAEVLAEEWTRTGRRPLTDALQAAGGLGAEALPTRVSIDGLVVVASTEETADPLASALGRAFAALGVPVAGGETTTQETKAVDAAVEAGLPAVDHIDQPDGVLSLVWILARDAKGHFGIDEGAVARFPEIRP